MAEAEERQTFQQLKTVVRRLKVCCVELALEIMPI
jgi:hypothetical protein